MILRTPDKFEENLSLLLEKTGRTDLVVALQAPKKWVFCETGKNKQINLKLADSDTTLYSPVNIDLEARQWASHNALDAVEVLIVFGIGLGYYYNEIRGWLNEKEGRRALFIEEDPSIIQAFLETDAASAFLADPKVSLLILLNNVNDEYFFNNSVRKTIFQKSHFTSLLYHEMNDKGAISRIRFAFDFFKNIHESANAELLLRGYAFLTNFYKNTLQLDRALLGSELFNRFKGVPAIVCGAGPSMHKNVALLKELKDKAIILAGGTAMNVLNGLGVIPHFGVIVDPYQYQISRIIANQAFETPYFIRSRMNAEAGEAITGPLLYLPGATAYAVSKWFDDKLKMPELKLDEGANVINTSLSIAKHLGCNPIIAVGVDLAYSDGLSYAPVIKVHAIHDQKEEFITKKSHENLVLAKDIYGNPVYTLTKWQVESEWYGLYALKNPGLNIVNCTEGGIGFYGIPNRVLSETVEMSCNETLDLQGRIAAELALAAQVPMPRTETLLSVMKAFTEQLQSAKDTLDEIHLKFPAIWSQQNPQFEGEALDLFNRFKETDAYQMLLKLIDTAFLEYTSSENSRALETSELIPSRLSFLHNIVIENMRYISDATSEKSTEEQYANAVHRQPEIKKYASTYFLEKDTFKISDEELDIELVEKYVSAPYDAKTGSGVKDTKEEDGLRHQRYYLKDKLHGPSTFFDSKDAVLCRSWFVKGERQGFLEAYYPNGEIHSKKGFKNGKEEGRYLNYYANKVLKTLIPYAEGEMDGKVLMYFPNGALKRSLEYKMGLRHGKDICYDIKGHMLFDVDYTEDKPFGIARQWYKNGVLAKEIVYDENHKAQQVSKWDVNGFPVISKAQDDYFDIITHQSLELTESLSSMVDSIENVYQPMKKEQKTANDTSLEDDFALLRDELNNFKELGALLKQESGIGDDSVKEAIWKSPEADDRIKEFVNSITGSLQENLIKLDGQMRSLGRDLKNKNNEQKPKSQNPDEPSI